MGKAQARKAEPVKHELRQLHPDLLLLDPLNPRLSRHEDGSSQADLLTIMIKRFKVEELAESIVTAGYLPFDPLLGVAEDGGEVTIVEGNRRLAAIKLLLDPEKAPERRKDTWRSISHRLSAKDRALIQSLTVVVYRNRDHPDLASYIGFRHVSGPLKWPALEKASYIASLQERGWTYEQIGERLGSRATYIERHFVAFRLVQQAVAENVPGVSKMEATFGVLMRALQSGGTNAFLGIKYPNDPKKSKAPVPKGRLESLRQFVEWTFGTDEKPPVIQDSRQLTKWGIILESSEALRYLKSAPEPKFDRAWIKSGGEAYALLESLRAASDRLEESVAVASFHKSDKEVPAILDRITTFLLKVLQDFPAVRERHGINAQHV